MPPQRPLPAVTPASDERRRERALASLFDAARTRALARYAALAKLPAYGRGGAMTALGRATLADLFREEMARREHRAAEGACRSDRAAEGARSPRRKAGEGSRPPHGDAALF